MEAVRSSETLVCMYQTTRRQIQEIISLVFQMKQLAFPITSYPIYYYLIVFPYEDA